MKSSCSHLIRAYSHLMSAGRYFYYYLIRVETCDVIKHGCGCNQVATPIALLRKLLPCHRVLNENFPCRQEPAVFRSLEGNTDGFWAVFMTKCQCGMGKRQNEVSNGVWSQLP